MNSLILTAATLTLPLLDAYLTHRQYELEPDTRAQVRSTVRRYLTAFAGQIPGHNETLRYLAQYSNPRTRQTMWAILRKFLFFAHRQGATDTSWRDDITIKSRPYTRHDPLSPEAVNKLLAACGPDYIGRRNYTMIMLYLNTACRRDEIRKLRLEDLDLSQRRFKARAKGGAIEWYALTETAAAALDAWLPHVDGQYLFKGRGRAADRPLSRYGLKASFDELAAVAGVTGFHPHALRHTCCQKLIDADCDLQTVQRILHHSSPNSTIKYFKLRDKKISQAMNAILGR
jgi:integrase